MEFCPVCTLRQALPGGVESGESSFEVTVKLVSGQATLRFEHYELVTGEDGKPIEQGRGAMGVTYKAYDIDCSVQWRWKSSASDISVTNRRNFVFCARRARRRGCALKCCYVSLPSRRFCVWHSRICVAHSLRRKEVDLLV
jgi:hypothetical protein